MQNLFKKSLFLFFLLITILYSNLLIAQDATTIPATTTETFVIQPWMWVVGGIIVLIILIAMIRGGSRTTHSERVVIKKED